MLKNKTNNHLKASDLLALKTVYLGIGTNKGIREKNISNAIKLLSNAKGIKLLKISKMLKNPPQEGVKNGYFLNGAIKLITSLTPLELLRECKRIERELGRRENGETGRRRKKKSRVIDLDILFYGNEMIDTRELIVPHPMIEKRYFVLIPLMEIGEKFVHPVLTKSIRELYFEFNKKIKQYA